MPRTGSVMVGRTLSWVPHINSCEPLVPQRSQNTCGCLWLKCLICNVSNTTSVRREIPSIEQPYMLFARVFGYSLHAIEKQGRTTTWDVQTQGLHGSIPCKARPRTSSTCRRPCLLDKYSSGECRKETLFHQQPLVSLV